MVSSTKNYIGSDNPLLSKSRNTLNLNGGNISWQVNIHQENGKKAENVDGRQGKKSLGDAKPKPKDEKVEKY